MEIRFEIPFLSNDNSNNNKNINSLCVESFATKNGIITINSTRLNNEESTESISEYKQTNKQTRERTNKHTENKRRST